MPRIVGTAWGAAPTAVEASADRQSAKRKRVRDAIRIVRIRFSRSARRTQPTPYYGTVILETRYRNAKGSKIV
jgi:hypothetical protein